MRHRVIVRAVSKQGFYRAGRFWPATNTEVEVDQETFDVLLKEPRLVVVPAPEQKPEVKADPKPEPKAKPDPKASETEKGK